MSMINSVLHTDAFYFAADYDLTHTLQRLANTSPEFQDMSLLERVTNTTPTSLSWVGLCTFVLTKIVHGQ